MTGAAFYCVADARFFVGAVALVNSLRLTGHAEPIFLLDCGLSAPQRRRLEAEATLVDGPTDASGHLLKAIAPLRHPAEVPILIDTDIIVTRSLAPLVERAAAGNVVAFENDRPRFDASWGELLGLGEPAPGPYVTSGLVLFGGEAGARALELFAELNPVVDFDRTFWRRNEPGYPFLYADQDVLNGVLRTAIAPDRVAALEHRLLPNPPFDGVRIDDAAALACSFRDGTTPYGLHHFAKKPWLARMRANVYSRLLTRVVLGPDVAVPLEPEELPPRLRLGARGSAARIGTDALYALPGVVRRVREHRERRVAAPEPRSAG